MSGVQSFADVLPTSVWATPSDSEWTRKKARLEAYRTRAPLDSVGADTGAFLVFLRIRSEARVRQIIRTARGRVTRLPRSSFLALAEELGAVAGAAGWRGPPDVEDLRGYLRQSANKGRDDTGWVLLIEPWVSRVSEPISAGSDDAAIFELLSSLGCRMPPTEGAT